MERALTVDRDEANRRIAEHGLWYHTIDVAPSVTTPGGFDLRHAVELMPWPDVEGKRCLDVGTFDGFFAFELERRGAAQVVAVDVDDDRLFDWPLDARPGVPGADTGLADKGPKKGVGFQILAELTGSRAEWRALNIYDLHPDVVGTFDVVVVGSMMLHLRDPVRALEAVRSVCRGTLLSSEQIEADLTLLARHRPVFRLDGSGPNCQWFVPNAAGHERLLWAAGFAVEARSRPYIERLNPIHRAATAGVPRPRFDLLSRVVTGDVRPVDAVRGRLMRALKRRLTGDASPGVLHQARLARPRL